MVMSFDIEDYNLQWDGMHDGELDICSSAEQGMKYISSYIS